MDMKRGWLGLLLLVVGLRAPLAAHAQVSAYGEFSGTYLHNLVTDYTLYGATTGVLIQGPSMKRFVLSADIQGRFVGSNGRRMDGVTVGPRFSIDLHRLKISPYAEFMIGFARYNNGAGLATTDGTFQVNGGAAKRVSPRWDVVLDYSYSQFYEGGGEFNPKTVSLGAVYHFVKR
jgi:hypothetical protein